MNTLSVALKSKISISKYTKEQYWNYKFATWSGNPVLIKITKKAIHTFSSPN